MVAGPIVHRNRQAGRQGVEIVATHSEGRRASRDQDLEVGGGGMGGRLLRQMSSTTTHRPSTFCQWAAPRPCRPASALRRPG